MSAGVSRWVLETAIWAGDVNTLHQLAPCRCCCVDHFSERCPARSWFGCLGQYSDLLTQSEEDSWAGHYERFHGMTREEFFS